MRSATEGGCSWACDMPLTLGTRRLHPLRFDGREGKRTVDEFDQIRRRIRRFRIRTHARDELDVDLNLRGKRSDQFDARCCQNLCDDWDPELNFTLGDKFGDDIRLRNSDLRLDGISDTKSLHQLRHTSNPEIGNRFGIKHRTLECLHRANVWLWRASTHFNAG